MADIIDMARAVKVATATAEGKPVPPKLPKPRHQVRVLTLREVLEKTANAAIAASGPTGFSTGHAILDRATGRVQPGDMWLLGADTNVGKSTLLTAILDVNLLAGKRCLVVTAEDDERKYGSRLLRRRADVNAYHMRDGKLTDFERDEVIRVAKAALPQPFFLDARGVDVEEVAAQIGWLCEQHGFDIVACDYVSAFQCTRRFQSPRETVEHKARTLTTTMRRAGVAGMLLTQLTIESRFVKPTVHNVRDSRDLGQWCDVAVFLYEAEKGLKASDGREYLSPGTKLAHVDKVKEGERGCIVPLNWDKRRAAFLDVRDKGDEFDGGFDDDFGGI